VLKSKRIKRWLKRLRISSGIGLLLFLILHWYFPLTVSIPYSQLVLSSEDEVMGAFLSTDDKWRLYLEDEEITPTIEEAFLLKEDRYFYWHPGVNPVAVVRALFKNIHNGKRTSGASTITMQLARMLNPKERTYSNKLVEMFRAFQLELKYSKKEILRLYLNLAPYGSNVEGIKSAAFLYLGKLPETLSPSEIAALTVIPNRPNSLGFYGDKQALFKEKNRWLRYFASHNWINSDYLEDALLEQVQAERRNIAFHAPHLCRRIHEQTPNKPIVRTSIQLNLQRRSQQLVYQYIERLKHRQISNAAALVLDNQTGAVLAYVGSADFMNSSAQGQVDGVQAIRSPGSTLKPFLYAASMQEGLFTPKSTFNDVPINLGGYSPENYDMTYKGRVSLEFALAQSLNIPAVNALHQLGVYDFVELLSKGGMRQIKADRKDLGLSMILGGCGVQLDELANLYRCMANDGWWTETSFYHDAATNLRFSLLRPEVCFMTTQILQKLERPEFPSDWKYGTKAPNIAWKTGTSYGRRDAWSIGFNKEFTVAVWAGNFDGTGVPDLSGAEIATPLLFDLFQGLPNVSAEDWLKPTGKLNIRSVCAATGQKPGAYCKDVIFDHFIPGISPYLPCSCHELFWLNESKDTVFCMSCKGNRHLQQEALEVLPPELIRFYDDHSISYNKLPVHNLNCTRIFQGDEPRITNPTHDAEYLLEKGSGQQMSFTADVAADAKWVYWYADDQYLGRCKPGKSFQYMPPSGELKISCADDKGRTTRMVVRVKYY